MELAQVAKELIVLARKDELSPSHHQRVRTLMKELRQMGMTNAQISELTGGRWAETTAKEYTRGVKVMDPQPWQSTTVLLSEMLSSGLTIEDIKETITVRDRLKDKGTSLAEITDLLAELKGTGIDVHALIALHEEWKSSGLTAPDIVSALEYKVEIEAEGFGLNSLSDIAQAAKAIGSPEDVLDAIGKYQDITELEEQLKTAHDRLADEESKIEEQIKVYEQQIKEVEQKEQSTRERLNQLEEEVSAKAELLSKAEELDKLGLDATRLSALYTAVTGMSAKHGLGHEEAVGKFFSQLKDYDASLGFEAEAKKWETIAETKMLEGERLKAELDGLETRYKERKEAVDAMGSLLKQGIKPDQISIWHRILSRFEGPEQFDQELEHYKEAEELLNVKKREIERRELKVAELDARTKALKQELAEIRGSIKSLSESGKKEITKISDKVVAKLHRLEEETNKWGEVKAKAAKLENELRFARCITTGDEAVLKALPQDVMLNFVNRVATWCRLNSLNPMVRVPDALSRKYYSISSYTEVHLLDLITWAQVGLREASQ